MEKAAQTTISKGRKIAKRVSTVLLILVFSFLVVCIGSVITTKFIYHKPAALFGYRIVKIVTDSMSPEIPVNSYILVKNIEGADVKEGDIVVHISATEPYTGLPMTHRCIKGPYYDEHLGQTCILTQGSNAGAPVDDPVPLGNVQSVYLRMMGKAGGFFDFLTSKWGISVMVALPCLIVVVLQIIRMVRAVMEKPDEDKVKEEAARIEKERNDSAKDAMLAEMMKGTEGTEKKSDVGGFGDVMAYIAREKAKSSAQGDGEKAPKANDEMSSVMAFIARQKAAQDADKKDE